jgi:hypothetical protein
LGGAGGVGGARRREGGVATREPAGGGELEPETEKMLGLAVAAVAASRAAARAAMPDCPSRAGKRRRQRGSVVEGRR